MAPELSNAYDKGLRKIYYNPEISDSFSVFVTIVKILYPSAKN